MPGTRNTQDGQTPDVRDPYWICIHCLCRVPNHAPDCCRKDDRDAR